MNIIIKTSLMLLAFMTLLSFTFPQNTAEPIPYLVNKNGGILKPTGKITSQDFKATQGIMARSCYQLGAPCTITYFDMTRQSVEKEPVGITNRKADFSTYIKAQIAKAKKGDIYYFDKIKCKCPGDKVERNLKSMVWMMVE